MSIFGTMKEGGVMSRSLEDRLRPAEKPRMIDLVAAAGLDVSDWGNFKGGPEKASVNPKYCYEWCYLQDGLIVLNVWHENMIFADRSVQIKLNVRTRPSDTFGIRRVRAQRFDAAVKQAYETDSHPRVIVQHRSLPGQGGVQWRLLDKAPWTVTAYEEATGDFVLERGIVAREISPVHSHNQDEELAGFAEGAVRQSFVRHRHREGAARAAKIERALDRNGGRLPCEVPGCGFDFLATSCDLRRGGTRVCAGSSSDPTCVIG